MPTSDSVGKCSSFAGLQNCAARSLQLSAGFGVGQKVRYNSSPLTYGGTCSKADTGFWDGLAGQGPLREKSDVHGHANGCRAVTRSSDGEPQTRLVP